MKEINTIKNLKAIFKLLRPKQWVKNLFVFIPLIFSGSAWDDIMLFNSASAFVLFCLAASAVYILNDICDLEYDKNHPLKATQRPLATGELKINTAIILLISCYALLLLQFWLFPEVFKIILSYVVLNVLYTFILKHQIIVDIFIISLGFMLRIVAGSVAINIQISPWMLIVTMSLSLYMTSIKKRQEIAAFDNTNNYKKSLRRTTLQKYNITLLDRYAEIAGASTFIFYTMYVCLINPALLGTVPLVMFGLFRYWYIVEEKNYGESPTDFILADRQLLLTVIVWVIYCTYILN